MCACASAISVACYITFSWGRCVGKKKSALGPRRTREHIIASQSHVYIEKFFVDKGHVVSRPPDDYGTDMLVNTFDENGYAEAGEIRIQLKAMDKLIYSNDNSYIPVQIETKHVHLWTKEPMPVFLILYDATARKAYWLYIQAYFAFTAAKPKMNAQTIVLRIPAKNKFTKWTVNYMRRKKAAVLEVELEHEE
jgi:hypothetical protein